MKAMPWAPSRVLAAAGTAGILVACNAVLGMDELPRASGDDGGRSGSGGTAGRGGTAGSGNGGGRAGSGVGESGHGQGGDDVTGTSGGTGGAAGSGTSGGTSGKGGSGGSANAGSAGTGGSQQVCVADSDECVDGHALHCNGDGSGYESDVLCTPTQTCVDGVCEDQQCEPESRFCLGNDVRQCAGDGLSSTVAETCEPSEYCDASSTTCTVGVCPPNEPTCDVDIATTCNADGSGYVAGGMPCGAGTSCDSGTCKTHECTPDSVFCQGQDLQQCASNGLTSTILDGCDADEYCATQNGGSCQPDVCTAGTRRCVGNTSQLCNQLGSAWTDDAVCSGGFCDSSGTCRTHAEIVGALDGRLIQMQCTDTPNADDCTARVVVDGVATGCSSSILSLIKDHPIGGTPGAEYQATIHFYGIVEPRIYGANVVREAGTTRPGNLGTGAVPVPWATAAPGAAFATTAYNSYEIHVLDQDMIERAIYLVNSDTQEGHFTYVLNFTKTIPVIGGGLVRLRTHDTNCRIIKNCGTTGGAPCGAKARTVDVSAANPQPVFTQPGLGQLVDHSGQWLLLDVTAVQ